MSMGPFTIDEEKNAVELTEQPEPALILLRMDTVEPAVISRKTDMNPPILLDAAVESDEPNRAQPLVDKSIPVNAESRVEILPRVVMIPA